jgi:hypothetical protein
LVCLLHHGLLSLDLDLLVVDVSLLVLFNGEQKRVVKQSARFKEVNVANKRVDESLVHRRHLEPLGCLRLSPAEVIVFPYRRGLQLTFGSAG